MRRAFGRRAAATRILSIACRVLALGALLFVCACAGGAGPACADAINDATYIFLENAKPCVRLLHKTGSVGCATPRNGWQGTLRSVTTAADLQALIAAAPGDRVAVVMPNALFGRDSLNAIRDGLPQVAGVLVLAGAAPPNGYSSAPRSPDCNISQTATADGSPGYPFCAPSPATGQLYAWNSVGDGAAMEHYDFAVVQMDADESRVVLAHATANEDDVRGGAYAPYAAEFSYQMFGTVNSVECLNNAQCMPVGGYSVWSTYGTFNRSLPWVVGTATMDAAAFFHDAAAGADAAMSGYIALFAAQQALAQVPGIAAGPAAAGLTRQIVFALFTGESWSHVGSRKFVADLASFECAQSDGNGGCSVPFKPSLAFTDLQLSTLYRALDVTQVGLNATLAMHRSRIDKPPQSAAADAAFVADLRAVAATVAGMGVDEPAPDTPGLPPSPLLAFIEQQPLLPAVALADHTGPYVNRYYRSEYDTTTNLRGGTAASAQQQLCSAATLAARALYVSAGGTVANASALVNADCGLVAKLYDCLTTDPACAYVASYLGSGLNSAGLVTHYSSVYQLMLREYLGGLSAFTALALADAGTNGSLAAYTHDAVDPALAFDYDQGMWRVGNTSQTYLWTESNWRASIWTRVFRRETPAVELAVIVTGFALVAVSVVVTYAVRQCCVRHFKTV